MPTNLEILQGQKAAILADYAQTALNLRALERKERDTAAHLQLVIDQITVAESAAKANEPKKEEPAPTATVP